MTSSRPQRMQERPPQPDRDSGAGRNCRRPLFGSVGYGEMKIWDLEQPMKSSDMIEDRFTAVAVSPHGHIAYLGHAAGEITEWRLEENRARRSLKYHTSSVVALAELPKKQLLVSAASEESAIVVWSLASGSKLRVIETARPVSYLKPLVTDRDSRLIGVSGDRIHVWDAATGKSQLDLYRDSDMIFTSVFSLSDGRTAVSSARGGGIALWDLANGSLIREISGHLSWLEVVGVLEDGRVLSAEPGGAW